MLVMNINLPVRIGKLVMLLMLISTVIQAQQLKLGANPSSLQKSALLELESTSQGLLLPRISDTTQPTMTSSPDGMLIFSKYDNTLRLRANGYWQKVLTNSAITSLNGQQQAAQTLATSYTPAGTFQFTSAAGAHTLTIPDASASQYGFVNTGAQTFGGNKTFNNDLLVGGSTTLNGVVNMNGLTVDNTKDSVVLIYGGMLYKKRLTASTGTVTSVALSMPGIFSVSGSPVTTSGTLTASLNTQAANQVFAGPATGAAAAPAFRGLVAADIPSLATSYIQNQSTVQTANYNISGNGTMAGNGTIGGTLTLSSLTAGSVPFINASKAVAQNNASFFWDATNNRLGVGNNTPGNTLEVSGTTGSTAGLRLTNLGTATPATATTKVLSVNANGDVIVTNNASVTNWLLGGNSNATASNFLGTTNAVDMVLKYNNTELFRGTAGTGTFSAYTISLFNGATAFNGHPVTIRANGNDVLAFEDASGTPKWHWNLLGSGLNFVESNVMDYRLFLQNGGNVGIGTSTPAAKLDVEGDFQLGTDGSVFSNMFRLSNVSVTDNNAFTNTSTNEITVNLAGPLGTKTILTGATIILNPRANFPERLGIGYVRRASATSIIIGLTNSGASTSLGTVSFDITVIN